MDSKPLHWIQSPPPTRTATPIPQNPYIDPSEEPIHLTYRSRIKPNRVQAIDPEDFLSGKVEESAGSGSKIFSKPNESYEFDAPYPRDEQGEEMSELARIWKIYNDEAARFDSSLTEGWNRGVDVLLVFTGLFSAVLTTFIIQSFQLMIPNASETTNALLQTLISFQANSSDQITITTPEQVPTPVQVAWVNGFWFAALACSLSTALISMLAKQWLQAYIANMSGSPRQRARQRQLRYMQLVSWHVLALINALPLLLHVALLLFFAGIVVLLWSVNRPTTLATLLIVVCAYIFYFGSIFLPVMYPDCPYQHPISEHLRKRLLLFRPSPITIDESDSGQFEENEEVLIVQRRNIVVAPDDKLDACTIIWLIDTSTDKGVISAALQAIAGLPRDFTAYQILRDVGVIKLIEQGFQSCFDQDTTLDLKRHLIDAEGAWLYCKAWMNMTRGTPKQWPLHLLEPLWKLQDLRNHPDSAAIASCVVALSSVDSHLAQWELLAYLSRYVSGQVQLSHCTVTWILDSMIDGLTQWVMPTAVVEKTTNRAVPVLLRLLKHIEDLPTSTVRSAAGLALYIFTCGYADTSDYQSEERRRSTHATVMVKALTAIVAAPERFGARELLDVAAKELCRIASPMVTQPHRFTPDLKDVARACLLNLLISERITPDITPDSTFADVLHLLNQSQMVPDMHRPSLVKVLVKSLSYCTHHDVASWSVRLLWPLLADCSFSVAKAFADNSGIDAVLRAAKIGDIDNRRLQVDSWRCFCALVDSCIALHIATGEDPSELSAAKRNLVDEIFRSSFFKTVRATITNRKWWLFEVSGRWSITFVNLCKLRPHERAWAKLIKVIRNTTEKGKEHEGMSEVLYQLESILYRTTPELGSLEETGIEDRTMDDDMSVQSFSIVEPQPVPAAEKTQWLETE